MKQKNLLAPKNSAKKPALIVVALLGIVGVAAVFFIRASGPQPFVWMINIGAVQQLENAGFSQANTEYFFNNPQTYYMRTPPKGWSSLPTVTYTSYQDLQTAFDNNQVDPRAKAIIYDNENWQFTPDEEKQNPAKYEMLAGQLIHAHHLIYISTPAVTLVKFQRPDSKAPYDDYLSLGFPRDAAKYADVYEIQAQGSQPSPLKYISFVTAAANQARQSNPNVTVLAGLSTNPNGQKVTSDQLYQAVQGTRSIVKGYWLNIPAQSDYCPGCGQPQPQVAIELLNKLLAETKPTPVSPSPPPPPPSPPANPTPPPPWTSPDSEPPSPPTSPGKQTNSVGAQKQTEIDKTVNSEAPGLKAPVPSSTWVPSWLTSLLKFLHFSN
ncbi:MAG TPA: hypothetical protein VLF41_01965 [Candidatus Nanoarchaeia archaeon]|nr:hypothetical protein [Candidatus Nanoarchaeia archaeon]